MSLGDNILLMLLFFACLTVCAVVCIFACLWLQQRFCEKAEHREADRFAVAPSGFASTPDEPAIGQIKLTPPRIETSFDGNERIGKL